MLTHSAKNEVSFQLAEICTFLMCEGIKYSVCQGHPNSSWGLFAQGLGVLQLQHRVRHWAPLCAKQQAPSCYCPSSFRTGIPQIWPLWGGDRERLVRGHPTRVSTWPPTRRKQRKRNAAHADFQVWDTLHGRAFSHINIVREERDSFPRQRTWNTWFFFRTERSRTVYCKRLVTFWVEPGKTLGSLRLLFLRKLLQSLVTQVLFSMNCSGDLQSLFLKLSWEGWILQKI